jgi:hypothetical protein
LYRTSITVDRIFTDSVRLWNSSAGSWADVTAILPSFTGRVGIAMIVEKKE